MKKYLQLLIIAFCILPLSCSKPQEENSIVINVPAKVEASYKAGSGTIPVNLLYSSGWSFGINFSGCVSSALYDASAGVIKYSVTENTTDAAREGQINLIASKTGKSSETASIKVVQEKKPSDGDGGGGQDEEDHHDRGDDGQDEDEDHHDRGDDGQDEDEDHHDRGDGTKADYGWFELPAQTDLDHNGIDDNNSDYYYSHTFRPDVTSRRVRNFSACYSKSKIHPVWVAAPMHQCYKGSSGRSNSYGNDPNIKCTQNGKFDGYTRGHLLGSSDRTISSATNKQVFYYSNIGAQLQDGFNTGGGVWNNLEDKVDSYWCADTLYQVIGCIFQDFTDKYGSTVKAKKGSGNAGSFQVPTAYYKVLLRTKKGNSGKRVDQCSASELQCVAFIISHKGNKGRKPSKQDLYTVEEVEKLTGLTFFVNVPNAPKNTFNASDWGL